MQPATLLAFLPFMAAFVSAAAIDTYAYPPVGDPPPFVCMEDGSV